MIASAFGSGGGTNPNGLAANTWGFVGQTVNVTVAVGQRIHVTSHKYMGSSVDATGLGTGICYQVQGGGGAPILQGGAMLGGQVSANTRIAWGASAVIQPAAGTYTVGLCASSGVPANWNLNEWGYTSALVFQP
ncbi:hypothetical protein [Paraliomyxa miuraensis]|uniref:hypothetical protein n=1 Tax=Paraliomyxa miuraensis TaxID=376150 RepID=UPI0022559959|nr:hypothetical protein [Paraliomyxa miuraensis]MCX4246715.1 hypothetical protein [Paraliomyxa miuraensis]